MAVIIDKEKCNACGACAEVCPVEAITITDVAEVNPDECVDCGTCIEECPQTAISEGE